MILHAGLCDPPVYQPSVLCEVFDRMFGTIVVRENAEDVKGSRRDLSGLSRGTA